MPEIIDQVKELLHLNKTVFDEKKVTVVFILGGPGVGKGTQCARLVQDFGFCHLSAGDLLRHEQDREGSQYGDMIKEYIRDGKIVPSEVTVKLLENAMHEVLEERKGHTEHGWGDGKGRFLVDGFPRKMDQALVFDQTVCQSQFVLFLTCTEEVMLQRLLERGKTSGRADDNEESIKKRFKTFLDTSLPVVEYYKDKGKVVEVVGTKTVDEVHEATKASVKTRLGLP